MHLKEKHTQIRVIKKCYSNFFFCGGGTKNIMCISEKALTYYCVTNTARFHDETYFPEIRKKKKKSFDNPHGAYNGRPIYAMYTRWSR